MPGLSNIRKTETKTFRYELNRPIVFSATLSSATPTLVAIIDQLPKGQVLKVKNLKGDLGITDDPTDEGISWFILECDPENLPDDNALFGTHDWVETQVWRSIGTVGQVVQVMDDVDVDFGDDLEYSSAPAADPNRAVCLLVRANTTSAVQAIVNIKIQRTKTQDNFADPTDEWDGYEMEEVMQYAQSHL